MGFSLICLFYPVPALWRMQSENLRLRNAIKKFHSLSRLMRSLIQSGGSAFTIKPTPSIPLDLALLLVTLFGDVGRNPVRERDLLRYKSSPAICSYPWCKRASSFLVLPKVLILI